MLQNIGILQYVVSIKEILELHVVEIFCFATSHFYHVILLIYTDMCSTMVAILKYNSVEQISTMVEIKGAAIRAGSR